MAAAALVFFLGGMLDEELDDDLGDNLGVNEQKINACTPYLVRQMSCLGRMTPGVKDIPF